MGRIVANQLCKRLAILLACFILAAAAGRIFAACEKKCEEMTCRSMSQWEQDNNKEEYDCFRFEDIHAPPFSGGGLEVTSRDPVGGVRAQTFEELELFQCQDCNPECVDQPSEAEECDLTEGCELHPASPIDQRICVPS